MLLSAKYLSGWRKRSVLFGGVAMLIGAALAFELGDVPVRELVRLVVGLDFLVLAALALVFAKLTASRSALN